MTKQSPITKRGRQSASTTRSTGAPTAGSGGASQGEPRRAALVAGFGLFAMAVVAGLANFGAVEAVLVDGDAAATGQNLAQSRTVFRLGVIGFGLVAVLDVIVAWALHVFFRSTSPRISAITAVVRIVYGGILAVATIQLAGALGADTDLDALHSIETFQDTWNIGLILFGAHLIMIAWLAWQAVRVPNWVAAFVAITGFGYVIDSIGALASDSYSTDITTFTFVGELILMFWLLIKGRTASVISPG